MSLEELERSSSWYVRFTMEEDVLLLADPQVYTRVLVWHDTRCVVEIMSMADGLPGKPNGGSCTIEFQQGGFDMLPKEKFLECVDSKCVYSYGGVRI